ncbi:MAG TPA: dTDP-4-dehydrorhamnose 3,5-epimerase family protein [Patescibacteria group bacterium]|nr:dTDP-4-dehydrorhamnose 3,5-epimerase family protein [Patescibacteria group bacterium]
MKKDSKSRNENVRDKPSATTVNVFADDRGVFVPFWESQTPTVKRVYYVANAARGIIRGFHFHKKEWKYFMVASGSAKFVALNPNKPKEVYTFVSSSRKANLVIIPPGFANGWISLSDDTILICCSTRTTKESLKDDVRFDPYKWGDVWSVKPR